MAEQIKPKLWSDFDGTAVSLVPKTNLRNWSKYPLPMVAGYLEFLQGAQETGVDIAGVVSRRHDIWPRRFVTERSVGQLGMKQFFASRDQLVLAGSEDKKAEFVASQSEAVAVGMIEDKPNKFGIALIKHLQETEGDVVKRSIVIGAVDHPRSSEYIGDLIDWVTYATSLTLKAGAGGYTKVGGSVDKFSVTVVPLEPYSENSGRIFAEELLSV